MSYYYSLLQAQSCSRLFVASVISTLCSSCTTAATNCFNSCLQCPSGCSDVQSVSSSSLCQFPWSCSYILSCPACSNQFKLQTSPEYCCIKTGHMLQVSPFSVYEQQQSPLDAEAPHFTGCGAVPSSPSPPPEGIHFIGWPPLLPPGHLSPTWPPVCDMRVSALPLVCPPGHPPEVSTHNLTLLLDGSPI